MTNKERRSLELTERQWRNLEEMARLSRQQAAAGTHTGQPSWRTFVRTLGDFEPGSKYGQVWIECDEADPDAVYAQSRDGAGPGLWLRRASTVDVALYIHTGIMDLYVEVHDESYHSHEWLFESGDLFGDGYDRLKFRLAYIRVE